MSQSPSETATERELAEDSLSAATYESDIEKKLKKKTSRKPPKSPKSPYTSSPCLHSKKAGFLRTFKGADSKLYEIPLVKASRQLWRESFKQGAWVSSAKPDLNVGPVLSAVPSGTPEYLKEALGMRKPKHARSANSGYIPGTPDYKEKEDMYDEIIELKKKIQAQKCEADRMKTKLRRLEEENNRKDKQIEQLLDPSRCSEFGWVRTEQKNDTTSQTPDRCEKHQCGRNENCHADLLRRGPATARPAGEIQSCATELLFPMSTPRSFPESKQQKMLNAAVLQLSRSINELQDENRKLKADLENVLSSSPASSKAKNYTEWSRQRLVRRISKLEKKMDEMQLSDSGTSRLLTPLASGPLDQSAAKESDSPEEVERLRRAVNKLKGQRVALQNQLAAKEEEIQKLKEKVRELGGTQEGSGRSDGMEAIELPSQNPYLPCLQMAADCKVDEEAVRLVQSVFRAHITRSQLQGRPLIVSPGSGRASPDPYSGEKQPLWSTFKYPFLRFTSTVHDASTHDQLQLSPSPLAKEVPSDDSDEIVTVSPSPAKKNVIS